MAAIFRDRAIVVASLAAIAGLAWAYLFTLSRHMSGMEDMPAMAMSWACAFLAHGHNVGRDDGWHDAA